MNTELFIAKRLYKGNKKNEKRVSSPAVSIAIAGIALGLVVMILSVSIVIGFKKEIRGKVIGFGSHIQITSFGDNNSYELFKALGDLIITGPTNTNVMDIRIILAKD